LTGGSDDIAGFIISDCRGLCIQAEGVGQTKSPGLISSLTSQASLLEPGRENPVILIESDQYNYMVKKDDNVTVTVIKNKA